MYRCGHTLMARKVGLCCSEVRWEGDMIQKCGAGYNRKVVRWEGSFIVMVAGYGGSLRCLAKNVDRSMTVVDLCRAGS